VASGGEILTAVVLRAQEGATLRETERPHQFSMEDFKTMGLLSDSGKIRLLPARRYFENNENYFPVLPALFEAWKTENEYMVLRHILEEKESLFAVKCAKRGNDVYNSRIKHRFGFLKRNMADYEFFSVRDISVNHEALTRALWITLTWNTRLFSIRDSWQSEIGKAWNRFITAMRRRYGKIHVLRAWETTSRGFPHIHAILIFETKQWSVFPWLSDKEARLSFRIKDKAEIEELWHSFVDVEAMSSMKKVIHYCMKYQLKVNEGKEDGRYPGKTLAFMWLFRKRSFAVSRSFFSRLDCGLHNSNMEPMETEGSFEFLGIFSGRLLGLTHGEWFAELRPDVLTGLISDGDPRVDQGYITNFEENA
jgi:hypothetical protein